MILLLSVLLVVQLIFSLWPVLVKGIVTDSLSPLYIVLCRDILASNCLWLAVWAIEGFPKLFSSDDNDGLIKRFPQILSSYNDQEKLIFIGLGIVCTVNSIGYVLALEYVTPFNSALLHPMVPVLAAVIGSLLGIEEVSYKKIFGFGVCMIGSIIVITSQTDRSISYSFIGNGLLLMQSMAMALLLVGQRYVDIRHSALQTTAIYYTLGTIISSPIIILVLLWHESVDILGFHDIMVIFYGAVFVVAINYVALTWSSKQASPSIPAASMLLQPPFTYVLGVVFLNQQSHDIYAIMGGSIIIFGLVYTLYPSNQYHQLEDEAGILLTQLHHDKHRMIGSSDHSRLLGGEMTGSVYDSDVDIPIRFVV